LAGRTEEAAGLALRVVAKDPNNAHHWINFSQVNLSLGHLKDALDAAEKAFAVDPSPQAQLALALAQLRNGDYVSGLLNFESRMEVNPVLRLLKSNPYPLWRGEDLTGKVLFIPCEQGIGDSIMFLPFIQQAAKRAKTVIVHAHAQVLKFYQRNLKGNVKALPVPTELPNADFFCPTMSLPVALQLTNEEILNTSHLLKFAPVHFAGVPQRKGKVHVGICWAGDPNHDNDRWRSANLEAFLRLAEVPNVRLFSLQVGERKNDLDTLGTHGTIKDLSPYIRDVNDTAALIHQHLDVVVSVDSAPAHIAGSVGKKTFLLHGARSVDWRWGLGEGNTAWYPNTVSLTQKTVGDWVEVIERVKGELQNIS